MKYFINSTLYELKQAYLNLKQKPLFVFSVVSTMGITLGALLCVLTLAYVMLIKPLPYPEQDRLYVAKHQIVNTKNEPQKNAFSYPSLLHLYKNNRAFEQAAMLYFDKMVLTSVKHQPLVNTTFVTPEFLELLNVPIALGRSFEQSEGLNRNNPVAMISFNTWQQLFNSSKTILQQKITVNGVSYRIIGVLGENFVEPEISAIGHKTQIWLPWDFNPESQENRQIFGNIKDNFQFIGRLAKELSPNQAQHLITPLVSKHWQQGFAAKYEFFKGWSVKMQLKPLKKVILGDNQKITFMLLAGVIGLVLIASANISNIFLSHFVENKHKMAIQTVMGANKKHLFTSVLAETSLLMLLAMLLTLVIAKIGFIVMQLYLSEALPRTTELAFDVNTLMFCVLVTLFFALFFAKLSIRSINYQRLNASLQSSGKGSGIQVSKQTRDLLVTSQIALATLLIFANISLFQDALKMVNAPLGFTTHNISTLTLNSSATNSPSEEENISFLTKFKSKIAALPEVDSIAQGSSPLQGFGIKALTKPNEKTKYIPYFKRIDDNYFNLIEQPLLQGNHFTLNDRQNNSHNMIVNQTFAKQLKTDKDVIGMHLSSIGEPDFKIIGIVKDIKLPRQTAFGSDVVSDNVPRAYAPIDFNELSFVIKIKENQFINKQQLSKAITNVDSRYSLFSLTASNDRLTQQLFTEITIAISTTVVATLVFLLAALGLYGVLNYSTQLRRFEIGTRMAIGAKRSDLISLIIKNNARAILSGIGISLLLITALVLGFSEQLQSYLTWQLIPLFLVTLGLVSLISFAGCYLPLRQYINKPATYSLRGSE